VAYFFGHPVEWTSGVILLYRPASLFCVVAQLIMNKFNGKLKCRSQLLNQQKSI